MTYHSTTIRVIHFLLITVLLIFSACSPGDDFSTQQITDSPLQTEPAHLEATTPITSKPEAVGGLIPTQTGGILPTASASEISLPTSLPPSQAATELPPDYWMSLPIIPTVSQTAREIYQKGITLGRDPHAFSKIGDCQSISTYFLKYFDLSGFYELGEYTTLQVTIDWYSGSFSRDSLAVKGGFNAAAVLSPLRADPQQCKSSENPIACEFHLHNPSLAIISLEEWWAGHPENYATYMRLIIEYSIQQGVLPIVATKADNLEGNHLINQTIAMLAHEYDIPLWNFWRAVQPLPNHGLIDVDANGVIDRFHLTHSANYYSYADPKAEPSGWSVRNLTALQVLDAVRRGLAEQP